MTRKSNYKWPIAVPSKKDIRVWKRLIMLLANLQGYLLDQLSFCVEYRLTSIEKYYLDKEIKFQLPNKTWVQNNVKFFTEDMFVLVLYKRTL